MKFQTLSVKRRPVSKGIMHRLHAATSRGRRQRVAAAATATTEIEEEHQGSGISRSLTIIFMIHIVAIALIFIHQQFLQGRSSDSTAASVPPHAGAQATSRNRGDLPQLSDGGRGYAVRSGDNYARIAAAEGVDEAELRELNNHVEIRSGLILRVPPQRIVAEEPPEVAAIRERSSVASERGRVVEVDVSGAPRAVLVRPNTGQRETAAEPAATGLTHVVQPGDSVYRIALRFDVSQESLMKANGIDDPRRLRVGTRLTIPDR